MDTDDDLARVYGPETWNTVAGRDWSWWDLWCCVIAVRDHNGDLPALGDLIAERIRTTPTGHGLYSRASDDARLSHVHYLDDRLRTAGLHPGDLADRSVLADRKIGSRARAKFKATIPTGAYARTPAMVDLPAERLRRRAFFGHWPTFPTDPTAFYDKFRSTVHRTDWVSERQTCRATQVLNDRLNKLDGPRRTLDERLALYRAFYTAAAEFADIADDSSAYLGDLRTEMWLEYLKIDWRSTPITPEHYWQDLCEICVWEDYAIDYRDERAWFRHARSDELELIRRILDDIAAEARAHVLDYQANAAAAAAKNLPGTPRSRRT